MARRPARGSHDSDAATTRWVKIAGWTILLGSIGLALYYLGSALWRIFGTIYRAYTQAGMIWPL